MSKRTCTVELRDRSFCDVPTADNVPFPICSKHAILLYETVKANLDAASPQALAQAEAKADQQMRDRQSAIDSQGDPVVYYVAINDLIKIGHTRDIQRRMTEFGPGAVLLATERGDFNTEAERLYLFREFLDHGKEWFRPAPALMAYIYNINHMQRLRRVARAS